MAVGDPPYGGVAIPHLTGRREGGPRKINGLLIPGQELGNILPGGGLRISPDIFDPLASSDLHRGRRAVRLKRQDRAANYWFVELPAIDAPLAPGVTSGVGAVPFSCGRFYLAGSTFYFSVFFYSFSLL